MLSHSNTSSSLLKLLICACFLLLSERCEASDGERRLYTDLFDNAGYNREIRPRRDPKQTIVVDIELDLNHLIKLDEHAEILQSSIIIDAEWDDDYLTWDPRTYDGVEQIVLSPTLIWIPDIGIQNSATNFYPVDEYAELFRAHVHHTGRVRWWFGGVMETSCHLDGTLFPFDLQSCSIILQSWAYSEAFVDLRNASDLVHLDGFNDDAIWHLLATSAKKRDVVFDLEPNVSYAQIQFVVHLERKPLYYIVNIIVPCCMLVVISHLVYWLPPDTEEKISLSMTVLLAFSVFLYVVNDLTPASSDTTPIIGAFVMVTIGLSTVSVITSIFVFRINDASTSPLPSCIRVFVLRYMARILCVPGSRTSHTSSMSVLPGDLSSNQSSTTNSNSKLTDAVGADSNRTDVGARQASTQGDCCRQLKPQIDDLLHELRKITHRQQMREREAEISEEWRTLAFCVDRLLFWISLLVLIGVVVWMILKSFQSPDIAHQRPH